MLIEIHLCIIRITALSIPATLFYAFVFLVKYLITNGEKFCSTRGFDELKNAFRDLTVVRMVYLNDY